MKLKHLKWNLNAERATLIFISKIEHTDLQKMAKVYAPACTAIWIRCHLVTKWQDNFASECPRYLLGATNIPRLLPCLPSLLVSPDTDHTAYRNLSRRISATKYAEILWKKCITTFNFVILLVLFWNTTLWYNYYDALLQRHTTESMNPIFVSI